LIAFSRLLLTWAILTHLPAIVFPQVPNAFAFDTAEGAAALQNEPPLRAWLR